MTPKSWLLVYLAKSNLPGERWVDVGNDPDLRTAPMTWGICRTNVRKWIHPDDELFFIAYRKDTGYSLSAYMTVLELIGQDDAVNRFPGRCNVILDRLPEGSTLTSRVRTYVARHRHELAWAPVERAAAAYALDDATSGSDNALLGFTVEIRGTTFVHAYYDEHEDWKQGRIGKDGRRYGSGRIDAGYVIADEGRSKILDDPIPYALLQADLPSLPAVDDLRNASNHHSHRRARSGAAAYLRVQVQAATGRSVPPFDMRNPARPCSEQIAGARLL